MEKTMINETANILIEAYLIKSKDRMNKGVLILNNGKTVVVPVQQLKLFNIPDFYLN